MLEDSKNADETYEDLFRYAGYEEFRLSKAETDSLSDIEKNLGKGTINSGNKDEILIYLRKLLDKIERIKNQEKPFEGNLNTNMDEYINHITTLITLISRI